MKAANLQPNWNSRNQHNHHILHPHNNQVQHPSLTPSFTAPRSAPKPPIHKSTLKVFNVFRNPSKAQSTASLHSAHSESSQPSSNENANFHPYSVMTPAPLPVVSSHVAPVEEDECPVCLEPLSFSFRLPGEKPHIVPECGHALHEACFSAVYGPPPSQSRSAVPRKSNLGVCGVCRRPMKVGDGDGGKSNKLAALTGMGDRNTAPVFPGRDTPTARNRVQAPTPKPYDPNEDDALDHTQTFRSPGGVDQNQQQSPYVVAPSIQARAEFSSISRTGDVSQPLTCIVVVELPGKRVQAHVPGPAPSDVYPPQSVPPKLDTRIEAGLARNQLGEFNPNRDSESSSTFPNGRLPRNGATLPLNSHFSASQDSYLSNSPREEESPFNAITEDLRNRIIDWKGHPLSDLGPLQMYDLLSVRRESLVREFFVYLFKEAIICVVEEKKRSLGRLLSNASGFTEGGSTGTNSSLSQSKGVLRLKGRIYVRHIKRVTASSTAGEMSLTIDMEDELASFILIFKDRSSLEAWKNTIQGLVKSFQHSRGIPPQPQAEVSRNLDIEEFGGSSKAARMMSGSTMTTVSTVDSLLNGASSRSTMSSSTSHSSNAYARQMQLGNKLSTLGEDEEVASMTGSYDPSPSSLVTPYTSSGPSNSLSPLPHPPLDLILVISLPPPTAVQSTAVLKTRVIKTTLDFVLASMGQRDRLSLVTFEVGVAGRVRKTPFLSPGNPRSHARLVKFIDETGYLFQDGMEDEFLVRGSKDEKTDVVTAVNHGLDVVLQRKARNPVSGMILVSDAADSTRRAQMDLVLARAEAANVPIHSFGYGRSHDPASLWLMSNHTNGTYTFVKDWYDLRDCVAGCVGGMMSIGLMNMKLHMKIVDGNRFRIRKVSGGPSSILASDGQNVDMDIGEVRYGERKEMLIELELDNTDVQQGMNGRRAQNWALNATDRFVQSMGMDSSIGDTSDLFDGVMDRMIDEVPVLEVDGSFFDPAAGKNVSRLAHPVLLTVTLLPLSKDSSQTPQKASDPVIVRRRMELLASDMITRALVLVSRKNYPQAQKIMNETKRILHTVLQTISKTLPPPNSNGNTVRNRREMLTLSAVRAMQSVLQDLQILSEALDENVELFAHDQRNFGAQQAMILRDQKSWNGRSATERLFWTTDNSIELVSRSTDWVARE